jgi:hypothetical protein
MRDHELQRHSESHALRLREVGLSRWCCRYFALLFSQEDEEWESDDFKKDGVSLRFALRTGAIMMSPRYRE